MSWLRNLLRVVSIRTFRSEHHEAEIASLQSSMKLLEDQVQKLHSKLDTKRRQESELTALQSSIKSLDNIRPPHSHQGSPMQSESSLEGHESESMSLRSSVKMLESEVKTLRWTLMSLTSSMPMSNIPSFSDDAFSLCFYEIPEYPSGTPLEVRSQRDVKACLSIINNIDPSINEESLWGVHRVGPFSQDSKNPRPVKVKFVRVADAARILLHSNSLSTRVKPHFSEEHRLRYKVLNKERQSLIDSGIGADSIRICSRAQILLVDGKIYGKLDSNHKFQYVTVTTGDTAESPQNDSDVTTKSYHI